MQTLPDWLGTDLRIVSIGLNPSLPSVEAGYPFANPRNRFWPALNASRLVDAPVTPGVAGIEWLFRRQRIGFTDVVKRGTRGGGELRAADYRRDAPVLADKLARYRPCLAWFHGKQAYRAYLRYARGDKPVRLEWGEQPARAGEPPTFVTPNPSPANAAYSLSDLTVWYDRLADRLGGACRAPAQ